MNHLLSFCLFISCLIQSSEQSPCKKQKCSSSSSIHTSNEQILHELHLTAKDLNDPGHSQAVWEYFQTQLQDCHKNKKALRKQFKNIQDVTHALYKTDRTRTMDLLKKYGSKLGEQEAIRLLIREARLEVATKRIREAWLKKPNKNFITMAKENAAYAKQHRLSAIRSQMICDLIADNQNMSYWQAWKQQSTAEKRRLEQELHQFVNNRFVVNPGMIIPTVSSVLTTINNDIHPSLKSRLLWPLILSYPFIKTEVAPQYLPCAYIALLMSLMNGENVLNLPYRGVVENPYHNFFRLIHGEEGKKQQTMAFFDALMQLKDKWPINARNSQGDTVLHVMMNGHLDVPFAFGRPDNNERYHRCFWGESTFPIRTSILQSLVEKLGKKLILSVRNKDGNTPLMLAAMVPHWVDVANQRKCGGPGLRNFYKTAFELLIDYDAFNYQEYIVKLILDTPSLESLIPKNSQPYDLSKVHEEYVDIVTQQALKFNFLIMHPDNFKQYKKVDENITAQLYKKLENSLALIPQSEINAAFSKNSIHPYDGFCTLPNKSIYAQAFQEWVMAATNFTTKSDEKILPNTESESTTIDTSSSSSSGVIPLREAFFSDTRCAINASRGCPFK